MKNILSAILFCSCMSVVCLGYEAPAVPDMVRAVYNAEGGPDATFLYGIRSVHYSSPEEARRICERSVINSIKRWNKSGRPCDFVEFMSRRYCPVHAPNDPHGVNRYWVKNVRFYLAHQSEKR